MARKTKKQWFKVDKQLFVLKQGDITTAAKSRQIYKIRVVQWGEYQAVLQKRLFVFSQDQMDYIPGRLMGFNMNDMNVIYQNQDKINKIMKDIFDNLKVEKTYKDRIIDQNNRNNEKKEVQL